MREGFLVRVERVGRAAGQWGLVNGLARALAAALCAWLILAGIDFVFRLGDPGLRWLLSLAAWSALGGSLARYVLPAWPRPVDPVRVARRLEQCFPQLRDRLASACEFVAQPSGSASTGSLELRRASISEAAVLADSLDFGQALDLNPVRRGLGILGVILLAGAALTIADPDLSRRGLARLAVPWLDAPWPRQHELQWVDLPVRVAAGEEVTLEVVDRHDRLPESVELWYSSVGEGGGRIEKVAMRRRDQMFVHRFESLTHSIRVRAVGGDDDAMPWRTIDVHEPPRLAAFEMQLIPPEYTGRGPERGGQPIRGVAGTRVQLLGFATRPISAVRVRSADGESANVAAGLVLDDGVGFMLGGFDQPPWVLHQSGTYVLELVDDTGLRFEAQRLVAQVLPDEPPTIAWELPVPDEAVTPGAQLPIRLVAKDDLAVRRVVLAFRTVNAASATGPAPSETDAAQHVDLYVGPSLAVPPSETMGDAPGESRLVEFQWDLGTVADLQAGMSLDVWIVAEDYKGQVVESPSRRVLLISTAELEERFGQREASLMHVLGEALRIQQETLQHLVGISGALRQAGRVEPRQVDQLQSAELQQRQVMRHLGDERDGAGYLIRVLLADVANNRRPNQALVQRLEYVRRELAELNRQDLPLIVPLLVAARKNPWTATVAPAGSRDSSPGPAPWDQVDDARRHAEAVCRRLEKLLAEMTPWDELRRVLREFGRMLRDQEELQRHTADLLRQSELETNNQVDGRRTAELAWQVERQFELERRFEKQTVRLESLRASAGAASPGEMQRALSTALDAVRQSRAAARMREAAEQLDDQRLGHALQLQDEAVDELRGLVERLSGRRETLAPPAAIPRIEQALVELVARYQSVQAVLTELEPLARDPPRQLAATAADRLAAAITDTKALTAQLSELAKAAEGPEMRAIGLALRGAVDQSNRALRLLESTTGPDLVAASESLHQVIRRLQMLLETLQPDAGTTAARSTPPDKSSTAKQRPASKQVRALADLKLLQSLQLELQRRTTELEAARRQRGMLTTEMAREAQELASEQGQLAELVHGLLESAAKEP